MTPETQTPKNNKARVNAERHEITGQFYAMSHEDRAAFNKNCKSILEDYNPQSARELWLANAIAEDMWRLDRSRGQENNIYALGYSGPVGAATNADDPEVHAAACNARTWLQDGKFIQSLALFETRVRRNMEKNEKELKTLQAERKARYEQALEEAKLLVQLAETEGETLDPEETIHAHGFAYSTREIVALVRREQRLARARALSNDARQLQKQGGKLVPHVPKAA